MKSLRISSAFNLHSQSKENVIEYVKAGLEFYKSAGFDAIDFGMSLLSLDSDESRAQAEELLKLSNSAGIRFEICHLPFIGGGGVKSDEYMEDFGKKMRRAIDAAAVLGVNYAVMHPIGGTFPLKKFNRREQYDTVMNHLSPFVEYAEKVGVKTVIENMRVIPGMMLSHRYCQTPDELCEIADALGIGVCWDFGHANISGIKQSEGLAYVGKRLKVIHVNDNGGIDDEHILPFTGNVDWKDAMHGLALAEFDGIFNFELAASKVPAALRKSYAAYVIAAARELMGYIE